MTEFDQNKNLSEFNNIFKSIKKESHMFLKIPLYK